MTRVDSSRGLSADRVASKMFADVFQSYLECSDEVQAAIRSMVQVINSEDATDDERDAALSTISAALFPSMCNGDLGIDLDDVERMAVGEVRAAVDQLNAEEATFSERLGRLMEVREMTQTDVAQAIDVGQSAVSMMLARQCRPQRRTVEKIARALKISVEDLWPGLKSE